ncbi:hypothetical protein C8R31_101373 [Nitrosospira sp. Nsp2]|nr:hypothetical protein C8R31_101373 [Nitrosospira sp. Nsp2]
MAKLDTKKEVAKETNVKQPMPSLAQPAGVRLSSMSTQTEKDVRVIMAASLSNFQVVGEKIRSKEPIERPELLVGVHLSIMPRANIGVMEMSKSSIGALSQDDPAATQNATAVSSSDEGTACTPEQLPRIRPMRITVQSKFFQEG